MPKYDYIVICAICLLSLLLTGCVEDADDPLTEGDVIGMLGPALTGSTPSVGASIHPDQSLQFFFNKPVSAVKVNGESIVLSVDRTQATFQGKLETGKLTVFWQWPQGLRKKEFKFVILLPETPASDPSAIPVKVMEAEEEVIEPEEEVIPQKEIDTTRMVLIPAGSFEMGDSKNEVENWMKRSRPVHTVKLDAFYMDAYEVTVGQFKQFVEESGYAYDRWNRVAESSPGDDYPMVYVNWHDATAYCEWVGKPADRSGMGVCRSWWIEGQALSVGG